MFIESGSNGVERLETGFTDTVVPLGEIESCGVFGRAFVEDFPEILR